MTCEFDGKDNIDVLALRIFVDFVGSLFVRSKNGSSRST